MLIKKVCSYNHRELSNNFIQAWKQNFCAWFSYSVLGRGRPQAPRAQPQGQRLQVPPYPHRIPHPPPQPLLQVRQCPAAELEI